MAALLIGTLCGCSGNTIHSTDFSAADTYSVPAGGYLNDLDPSLDLSTVAAAPSSLPLWRGFPSCVRRRRPCSIRGSLMTLSCWISAPAACCIPIRAYIPISRLRMMRSSFRIAGIDSVIIITTASWCRPRPIPNVITGMTKIRLRSRKRMPEHP